MERKNPHWIFFVIAALLLIVAVLLVAVLLKPQQTLRQEAMDSNGTQLATQPQEITLDATLPEQTTGQTLPNPGIPIDCRWITLFLPEELEGVVTYRQTELEEGLRISFYGLVGEQEVALFAFDLSHEICDGFRLGQLTFDDAQLHIYSYVYEQSAEDWSAEDYHRIDQLQQRVNDFVAQFYEDARFQPDRQA